LFSISLYKVSWQKPTRSEFLVGLRGLVVKMSDSIPIMDHLLVTFGKSLYFDCLVLSMWRKTEIPCSWKSMPGQANDLAQRLSTVVNSPSFLKKNSQTWNYWAKMVQNKNTVIW
jgi:hypothetical protein